MKFLKYRHASVSVAALCASLLVGCASDLPVNPRTTRATPTEHKSLEFAPALRAATGNVDEKLRARVEQRWSALIQGDLTTAYMLMSPNSRKLLTEAEFRQRVKAGMWKSREVVGAKCDGTVCRVDLIIGVAVSVKGAGLTALTVGRTEDWINVGGEWFLSNFQDK